jgi:hypothetical protein
LALFNSEHDRSMSAAPTILSYDFWKRRFGSDASVIGKTARVNEYPLTIIGVAGGVPTSIEVGSAPDLFVPIVMRSEVTGRAGWNNRNNSWLYVVGRLKSATSIAQVESELSVISKQQEEQERRTAANPRFVNTGMPVKLLPGAQGYSGLRNRLSQPLIVLMIIVGVVLLIACANVANLLWRVLLREVTKWQCGWQSAPAVAGSWRNSSPRACCCPSWAASPACSSPLSACGCSWV